jgi:outer membrane protein OmpA-like peptidoglycan-associated protein
MRFTSAFFVLLFCYFTGKTQEQLVHEPKLHVDQNQQVFIRADQKAYFFVSPAETPGDLMFIPSEDKDSNPMSFDGDGTHYISSVDSKTGKAIRFKILADGIAPETSISFQSGALFQYNNAHFVEKGAFVKFEVKDNLSGAGQTFASINGEAYQQVMEGITIEVDGESKLKYYSVDHVGNVEVVKEIRVFASKDATVSMENIYFDLNSEKLKKESIQELDKLARLLIAYPNVHIELSAHTDARGESRYNLKLSELRAQSAVSYLISRGVKRERITSRGYGDSKPLNNCGKGVSCSEDMHRQNRRVEITISKIEGN